MFRKSDWTDQKIEVVIANLCERASPWRLELFWRAALFSSCGTALRPPTIAPLPGSLLIFESGRVSRGPRSTFADAESFSSAFSV